MSDLTVSEPERTLYLKLIGLINIYSGRDDDKHIDQNSHFWLDYSITGNYIHYILLLGIFILVNNKLG